MIDEKKLIEELNNAEEEYRAKIALENLEEDSFSDGILSALFSVNRLIKEQPTVGEWIPCEVDMPKEQYIDNMSTENDVDNIKKEYQAKVRKCIERMKASVYRIDDSATLSTRDVIDEEDVFEIIKEEMGVKE